MPRADEYYTTGEVAELLKVSSATVRRWLQDGRLSGVRLSRRGGWRVRGSALRSFLRDRSNERG